jgi:hypothetical protein
VANRYWVGGTAIWDATAGSKWSSVSPTVFTASCTGTDLTTTGSPALSVGNTVWSNTNVSLGTIVSGGGDTWVVSIGGTFASQTMYAATTGAPAPVAGDSAEFKVPTTYTVTLSGALAYFAIAVTTGTVTFAGSGTSTIGSAIAFDVPVTWSASGLITFNGLIGGSIRADGTTFNCNITITHANGYTAPFELFSNVTLGATNTFTFTQGALTLYSRTLSTGVFTTTGTGDRDLNFGTGKILLTGTGTVWTSTGTTNLITSGTSRLVEVTTSAGATTVNSGSLSEAYAIDFTFLAGSGTVTLGAGSKRNLSFAGYTGNVGSNTDQTIYGNVHFGSGTFTGGAGGDWIFRSTSATPRTITTNSRTLTFDINFNGVGGTWVLQDALLMATNRGVIHTNGTLNLNAQTLTVGSDYTTATGTKNLTFNGGNLVCSGSGTVFNNAAPAGYTTTAGTGTGKIRMTSASIKTFVAGTGVVYNCTLDQAGLGQLTITGGSTFNDIINSVQPATVRFTAGTTTTFNNFNLRGTAGNLITISSATAATHTLSKASGTVSCDYLSITNSIVTGGASWYAGANSTNVSGNTDWIFTAPPSGGVTVNVTGVFASGVIGTATVAAAANILTTGPPATGDVGTVTTTGLANVTLTGVSAQAIDNGVGVASGGGISVDVFENAAAGTVGTVAATGLANVTLTGAQADGFIGDSTVAAKANVSLTGVQANGFIGDVTVAAKANVSLTGVQARGFIGTETVAVPASVTLTGVLANGAIGTVTITDGSSVNLTGVEASGSVGSVTFIDAANIFPTGVSASGDIGTATVSITAIIAPDRFDNQNSFFAANLYQYLALFPSTIPSSNQFFPLVVYRGAPTPTWQREATAGNENFTGADMIANPSWARVPTSPTPNFTLDNQTAVPDWIQQ